MPTSTRPKALVFDVNETLLDLSGVQQAFRQTFSEPFAFKFWFSQLLNFSLVDTVTKNYHNFRQLGAAALTVTAAFFDKELGAEAQKNLLAKMGELPPHPDVAEGLKQLKEAGFRLVTLTNSPGDTLTKLMNESGLGVYFEATWTVDDVHLYKPHPTTYQMALDRLELKAEETMMVAAHGWDIAGATNAGMQTAFIARPGQSLYPLAPAPTLIGPTLTAIARQLLEK